MSSSTRSQQALTEQMSMGEKLGITPNLILSYAAGLAAVFTSLFQTSDQKVPTMRRQFLYTNTRNITQRMSVAQMQLALPPTDVAYAKACKRHGLSPKSEVLEDGTQAHWIGPSTAEKVIINFHGGGYVLPSGWEYLEFMYQLQQILSKEGKDVAVLFLSYDLSPTAKYPRQLQQAAALLSHVLHTLHKLPSNIILTGDSAGGNLALALISHTIHPHPSTSTPIPRISLPSPLRALVLTSPWVYFGSSLPSYKANAHKDLISLTTGHKWSTAFMGTPAPHGADTDPYNQPMTAPPEWWTGLPVQEVLVMAGKDESMVDSIVAFAEKLRGGMGVGRDENRQEKERVTVFVAEGESHNMPNLDLQFRHEEPGKQARLMRSWIASKL